MRYVLFSQMHFVVGKSQHAKERHMTFYSFMHKYRNSKHKTEHDENLPSQKDLEKYCNLQQVSEKKKGNLICVYEKLFTFFSLEQK